MIYNTLDISTAHIGPFSANWLNSDTIDNLIIYPKGEYGWFIHVPEDIPHNLPVDIKYALKHAKIMNCQWLCIDRDGDIIPELATYDW